mgnify:CR=1 FL=1
MRAGVPRRDVLAAATDDLLAWWLTGTHDEHMREWWSTPEAVDTATEVVHVMLQTIEEHGWQIVPA